MTTTQNISTIGSAEAADAFVARRLDSTAPLAHPTVALRVLLREALDVLIYCDVDDTDALVGSALLVLAVDRKMASVR